MDKEKKKHSIGAMVRELFESLPIQLNYLVTFLLLLFLFFFFIPDPIPLVDEIVVGYLAYHSIVALRKKRKFRLEAYPSRSKLRSKKGLRKYEDKMGNIVRLFRDIKKLLLRYKESSFLRAEGEKFQQLLPKVEKIRKRIQKLDKILMSSDFQEESLEMDLAQVSRDLSDADSEKEKKELKAAREYAEKTIQTVKNLKNNRNILVARLEKFYFLLKETHSKILAMDLSEDSVTEDISKDITSLLEAVDTFDNAMKELGKDTIPLSPLLDDMENKYTPTPPEIE